MASGVRGRVVAREAPEAQQSKAAIQLGGVPIRSRRHAVNELVNWWLYVWHNGWALYAGLALLLAFTLGVVVSEH